MTQTDGMDAFDVSSNGRHPDPEHLGGDDLPARLVRWKSLFLQTRLHARMEETFRAHCAFDAPRAWEQVTCDFEAMSNADKQRLWSDFEAMDRSHSPDD